MIKKVVRYLFSTFGVGLLYCLGFLVLRETHPFSRFPMYSSFPNWAYVFYFGDDQGELIPSEQFNVNAGNVAHFYYSFNHSNDFICGNFLESKNELAVTGKAMIDNYVKSSEQIDLDMKSIGIYRIGFRYEGDSIRTVKELMYERVH